MPRSQFRRWFHGENCKHSNPRTSSTLLPRNTCFIQLTGNPENRQEWTYRVPARGIRRISIIVLLIDILARSRAIRNVNIAGRTERHRRVRERKLDNRWHFILFRSKIPAAARVPEWKSDLRSRAISKRTSWVIKVKGEREVRKGKEEG